MSVPLGKDRRLVPRWRDSRTSAALNELSPLSRRKSILPPGYDLQAKINLWRKNKTLSYAADLIGTALAIGDSQAAREAAVFAEGASASSPLLIASAKRILEKIDGQSPASGGHVTEDRIRSRIRRAKARLRMDPRNYLAHADLALFYASLGQNSKAVSSMLDAVTLAPDDRYVVRSASRLFVHIDEADRALWLLRGASHSKRDPWLLAAEVGISVLQEQSPRLLRPARHVLEAGSFSFYDTAELASALATLEAWGGKSGKARALFGDSLRQPTENAVAQAQWASRRLNFSGFDPSLLRTSFEAQAADALRGGEWEKSYASAVQWLNDQLFSIDPASFASYVASIALNDHNRALAVLEVAKVANRSDWLLTNNRSFSLASLNRVEEAQSEISKIDLDASDLKQLGTVSATQGLIAFRMGNVVVGRSLYHAALEVFRGFSQENLALASALLASEEIRALSAEGEAALTRAVEAAKAVALPEVDAINARSRAAMEFVKQAGRERP